MRPGEVWLVDFDPSRGAETQKTRPAVVVSPDAVNARLHTVIVAPLTSRVRHWPTRVRTQFQGKQGEAALDQVRVVDKARLLQKLGAVSEAERRQISKVLQELFAY